MGADQRCKGACSDLELSVRLHPLSQAPPSSKYGHFWCQKSKMALDKMPNSLVSKRRVETRKLCNVLSSVKKLMSHRELLISWCLSSKIKQPASRPSVQQLVDIRLLFLKLTPAQLDRYWSLQSSAGLGVNSLSARCFMGPAGRWAPRPLLHRQRKARHHLTAPHRYTLAALN